MVIKQDGRRVAEMKFKIVQVQSLAMERIAMFRYNTNYNGVRKRLTNVYLYGVSCCTDVTRVTRQSDKSLKPYPKCEVSETCAASQSSRTPIRRKRIE